MLGFERFMGDYCCVTMMVGPGQRSHGTTSFESIWYRRQIVIHGTIGLGDIEHLLQNILVGILSVKDQLAATARIGY